jgi:hypothetical protein
MQAASPNILAAARHLAASQAVFQKLTAVQQQFPTLRKTTTTTGAVL